jgi:integrase
MPRRPRKVKGISVRYDRTKRCWRVWFKINKQAWSRAYASEALANETAQEYGRRLLAGEDIRPAHLRAPAPPKPVTAGTVRAEGNTWIIERQHELSPAITDLRAGHFHGYICPTLGDLPVHDKTLTREACIAFARSLVGRVSEETGKPLRFGTRKAICRTLSAFCGWARDQARIPLGSNPADKLRKYVVDADELTAPILVWTHEQVERLLKVTQEQAAHWYAFLYIAIKTGLRKGELIELQWEKDFEIAHHVFVQRQYRTRKRKRYAEDAEGRLTREPNDTAARVVQTKGKALREVPLRPADEQVLARHRTSQKAWALKSRKPLPTLCFVGPVQGHRVQVGNFETRILPELCRAAKVPVTTKLHTTRHTFATVLLTAGVPVGDVSMWLGHVDTAMTERIYKHWIRDRRREAELGRMVDEAWRV